MAIKTERAQVDYQHPLDALIPDPTGMEPLCGEEDFASMMEGDVADEAPKVFAVVQEYGNRVDYRIAAWGIAFDDHAEVVAVDRGMRMRLREPESALRGFAWGSHISSHLVWVTSKAAANNDERGGF